VAAGKLGIKTLEGGPMGGQLVCVTSPASRDCNPRVSTLEDPDEGIPVHIRVHYYCIIPTPREKYSF